MTRNTCLANERRRVSRELVDFADAVHCQTTVASHGVDSPTELSSWSSQECSPPCHGGGRGFKSRWGRCLVLLDGAVRNLGKRRSSELRDSVGSTPTRAIEREARDGRWEAGEGRKKNAEVRTARSFSGRTLGSQSGNMGSIPIRATGGGARDGGRLCISLVSRLSPLASRARPSGVTGKHTALKTPSS